MCSDPPRVNKHERTPVEQEAHDIACGIFVLMGVMALFVALGIAAIILRQFVDLGPLG